jgi:hypothetical protein
MAQALVAIQGVTLSKNPVSTGEKFIISVDVLSFDPETPQRKLPFKLGKRKEVQ